MVIDDGETDKRLNNPLNLINRLRGGLIPIAKRNPAMDLFIPPSVSVGISNSETGRVSSVVVVPEPIEINPAYYPTPEVIPSSSGEMKPVSADDILDDAEGKIKLALAHDDALGLLSSSIRSLKDKVETNGVKPSALPSIIISASRVITDIRKERLEREKTNKGQDVHIHFYCPTQRKVNEYEVIDVVS